MVRGHFWENTFLNHFFNPFLVLKRPLFKAFWNFPWAKARHHELKIA